MKVQIGINAVEDKAFPTFKMAKNVVRRLIKAGRAHRNRNPLNMYDGKNRN